VTDIALPNNGVTNTASSKLLGLVVCLALAAVVLLTVVTLMYSNHNTPASVNGTTVTSSQWIGN
jgi:hypothetical protein